MSKIGLLKLERYPNLALEKVRVYHQDRGHEEKYCEIAANRCRQSVMRLEV